MLTNLQSKQGSEGTTGPCSAPCQLRWLKGQLHLAWTRVAQRLGPRSIQTSPTHTSGDWGWGDSHSCELTQLLLLGYLSPPLCGHSSIEASGRQTSYVMGIPRQVSREQQPGRSCITFYDLPSTVTQGHFLHILSIGCESSWANSHSRGGERLHLGGCSVH